jgi:two-component system, NtrC family, sensor kinase
LFLPISNSVKEKNMEELIRILFVDDERNVLRSLERTFLDEEYEILTANSGAEGLQTLQDVFPIQVVISDYRMPEMTGVDFLREVCKKWPDTVRIVLSGYADTASIVSAINEGEIYKFIPKPWNDDELKVTIVNALERYSLNKKNEELTEALKAKNEELERINNDLERMINEKTTKYLLQKEVIKRVQDITDAIPVGIIGIDLDGVIVQCNLEAEKILCSDTPDLLGNRYCEKLPEGVCSFIENIPTQEAMSGRFFINGHALKMTVGFMNNTNQKGTILVFDRE